MPYELTITTGEVPFAYAPLPSPGKTWYRLVLPIVPAAAAVPEPPPLVVLHGGPGATHAYLVPTFDALAARTGRAVVYYDQIGNGNSTRYRETRMTGDALWKPKLFVDELRNLIAYLGLDKGPLGFDIYGQSWGSMLAACYAIECARDSGFPAARRIVLGSGMAAMPLWEAYSRKLIARLPADVAATLLDCEARGDYESPEWHAAVGVFYSRYLYRSADPDAGEAAWPPALRESFAAIAADDTVYATMNGPSEFTIVGTLRDFDIRAGLPAITAPVLVLNGEFDEAGDEVVAPLFWGVGGRSRWVTLKGCSHSAHLEDPDKYIELVDEFLNA